MLMEELFGGGLMTMGPSRADPARQVGVLRAGAVGGLAAARAAEMEKFAWIAGQWSYENRVPATRFNPAYADIGTCRFAMGTGGWLCLVEASGSQTPQITFDPFSRQWIYLLTRGSYGMLRSRDAWVEDRIAFTGTMTMLGIEREWRMTWTKKSGDCFGFVNEEPSGDGGWAYIDEWEFRRL